MTPIESIQKQVLPLRVSQSSRYQSQEALLLNFIRMLWIRLRENGSGEERFHLEGKVAIHESMSQRIGPSH